MIALIGHELGGKDTSAALTMTDDLSMSFKNGKDAPEVLATEVVETLCDALVIPHGGSLSRPITDIPRAHSFTLCQVTSCSVSRKPPPGSLSSHALRP